jgi:SAM-dependent methyltransferase
MLAPFFTNQTARAHTRLLERLLDDREYAEDMGRHPLHASMLDWLPRGAGRSVLELGCGPGKYVAQLASLGFEVTGVDPFSFPTWETIRAKTSAKLMEGVVAERLPFPDHYFDHAVCLGAILYFDDPQRGLSEMRRVTKPGGHVVIRTPNRLNYYTARTGRKLDPASKNLYSMDELVQLVRGAGFKVESTFSAGYWPPVLTDVWWHLISVWIPLWAQTRLSQLTPPTRRVNNVVFATA